MSFVDAVRRHGSRPQRLGLLAHGFANWGGGVDFLRMILTSLRQADPSVELHVLAPTRGPLVMARNLRDTMSGLLGRTNMGAHRPQLAHLECALADTGSILHLIDIGPRALARAASRLQLDALLPAIVPQVTQGVPWVGYIPDFQHKYLPQFFSDGERLKRDQEFGRMLANADAVVVNARDVAKDIDTYYPSHRARIYAMPFSPAPAADAFSVDIAEACCRYAVKGPYFIICNQFWKHKDHGTAFRAFAEVAKRHPMLKLVCTGACSDYRFPDHFGQLMQKATIDGVADRILVLGLIPKLDQIALMRGALALVQPTLFEGGPGGGAVYDAVSVGQRSLVSDIAVNTEIDEPGVTFFEAGNAASLAVHMEAALAQPKTPALDTSTLIDMGITRRRDCGQVLLQAVEFVRSYSLSS